jgi:hypothetical protein
MNVSDFAVRDARDRKLVDTTDKVALEKTVTGRYEGKKILFI